MLITWARNDSEIKRAAPDLKTQVWVITDASNLGLTKTWVKLNDAMLAQIKPGDLIILVWYVGSEKLDMNLPM